MEVESFGQDAAHPRHNGFAEKKKRASDAGNISLLQNMPSFFNLASFLLLALNGTNTKANTAIWRYGVTTVAKGVVPTGSTRIRI